MDFTISPLAVLIIFIVILIISLIGASSSNNYSNFNNSSLHTFLVIFSSLGFILTFILLYSVVILQQSQQELAVIDQTTRIGDAIYLKLHDQITESAELIPNFIYSLNPIGTAHLESLPPDPQTPVTNIRRNVLAAKIFNVWQQVVVSDLYNQVDTLPFVANSLQRANSKQLYAIWKVHKLNYNQEVQLLGDLFFEYALPITNQTTEEYLRVSRELIDDPRFQKILTL